MLDLSESTDFNFIGTNIQKRQIILADSKRNYKDYINSLKYRYNKKNQYLPNYVITKEGEIYLIVRPENYSKFMNDEDIDNKSIVIVLENYGWLKKNPVDLQYVTWLGDIYKVEEVYEKKWRDYFYWDKYTEIQIKKLSELILELCDNFKIPKNTIGHNVRQDGANNFNGIVSRSNFNFISKDVNPSFDFELIEKKLKNVE